MNICAVSEPSKSVNGLTVTDTRAFKLCPIFYGQAPTLPNFLTALDDVSIANYRDNLVFGSHPGAAPAETTQKIINATDSSTDRLPEGRLRSKHIMATHQLDDLQSRGRLTLNALRQTMVKAYQECTDFEVARRRHHRWLTSFRRSKPESGVTNPGANARVRRQRVG